jgi:hypothetical protein
MLALAIQRRAPLLLIRSALAYLALIAAILALLPGMAGLVLAVMLLSSVLGRTSDLQKISVSLFGGRPLVRYLSLAFGTAMVSVPLNFGSVAVVGERIRSNGDSAGYPQRHPRRAQGLWCIADLFAVVDFCGAYIDVAAGPWQPSVADAYHPFFHRVAVFRIDLARTRTG